MHSKASPTAKRLGANTRQAGFDADLPEDRAKDKDLLAHVIHSVCRQFKRLFHCMGVHFEVEDEAKRVIAQHAISRKTGARGLRSAYEELLLDAQFTIPEMEDVEAVRLTADVARNLERKLKDQEVPLAHAEIIRRMKSA